MKNRIQSIINLEKLSAAEFASLLGIQRSTLSNIIGGRNNPSYDILNSILTKFPNLNFEWLMNGNGQPYKDNSKNLRGEPLGAPVVEKKTNSNYEDYPTDLFSIEEPIHNDDPLVPEELSPLQSTVSSEEEIPITQNPDDILPQNQSSILENDSQSRIEEDKSDVTTTKSSENQLHISKDTSVVNSIENLGIDNKTGKRFLKRVVLLYSDGSFEDYSIES